MSNFIDFARAHGLEIDPGRLYPSDKIRRCGTVEKPRSGNGAYFYDGQRGWVFDWSGAAQTIWYNDPNAKPWTARPISLIASQIWAICCGFSVAEEGRLIPLRDSSAATGNSSPSA